MEFLIYFKTFTLIFILLICGFLIVRRICDDLRIQILLPISIITGIALYIFLLNLIAYVVKGQTGFYLALVFEILIAVFLKIKIKPEKVTFPKKKEKVFWVISLLIWFVFLFQVTATGSAASPDWLHNSYFASLVLRGDFPIHNPFQPDKLAAYHIGMPVILGLFRLFSAGADTFLGSTIALITLFSMSQIFQWILKIKNTAFNFILLTFIPLTAIVSLGNFMFVWPYTFSLPDISNGIISWLHNLPTLNNTYDSYGAPASLDSLNLFLHRMLSLSIFTALVPLTLYANKSRKFLSSAVILILIATLALSDESVFIVTVPAISLILFFTLFEKSIKKWILFCLITLAVSVFQGGLINEAIFKSEGTIAKVLFFPSDEKNPAARFEKYHSYRMDAQKSKLIQDKQEYSPFRWFHFGALWQVGALFIACLILNLFLIKTGWNKSYLYLTWLFSLSSIIALVAFHGIVPKGWTHLNGNRFLSLSYQLSGIGIIIFIIFAWVNLKGTNIISKFYSIGAKFLIAWFVLISTLPTIAILFPREKLNWFKIVTEPSKPEYMWIRDNLKVDTRILPFTDKFPSDSPVELAKYVGIFTPLWYEKPEAQGSGTTPPYLDVFYTQNPEILKTLKVEYIMTNKLYRSTLPANRLEDLKKMEYFEIVYIDNQSDVIISKILPAYFAKAENYKGTFYELEQILPTKGAFFIEKGPAIKEAVWRVAFLTLQMHNYEVYYSLSYIPVYNYIINVDLKFNGETNSKYDYLVLGPDTDPKLVCQCEATLIWSQIAGYVNVWKVN